MSNEITQTIVNMLLDILQAQSKDKELRIKTNAGTLVIRLVNEEEETNSLVDRVKKAQDLVPEMEEK